MVSLRASALLGALPLPALGGTELESKAALNRREEYGDNSDLDSYGYFAAHSIAILDSYLYIDGGQIAWDGNKDSGTREPEVVTSTISIPLDEPWTNSSVTLKHTNKTGVVASVSYGALWVDKSAKRIYNWGGDRGYVEGVDDKDKSEGQPTNDKLKLLVFGPDGDGGGIWSTQEPRNPDLFNELLTSAAAAYASCGNTGYYLGGLRRVSINDTSETYAPSNGLLSFNMETKEWTKEPSDQFNSPYGTFRRGRAVCGTAADSDPLLFFLGGEAALQDEEPETVQMNNLTFYHPEDKRWHWQLASGDIPEPRVFFCALGIRSPDGTYEIFIYGGETKEAIVPDIYVLSIPAFRWFKVDGGGHRREHHNCAAADNRQMIVVGGGAASQDNPKGRRRDEWPWGLGVFDMHELQWKDRYDPDAAPYESPAIIKDWYAEGGFDTIGWNSGEVKSMFAGFEPSSGSGSDDQNKKAIRAIVGGSVGGVAGLVAVGGLVAWLLRRRKRKAAPIDASAEERMDKNPQELYTSGYDMSPPVQELDAAGEAGVLSGRELAGIEAGAAWAGADSAKGKGGGPMSPCELPATPL